jgi:lipoprotein-releasing system ATP-binding protein
MADADLHLELVGLSHAFPGQAPLFAGLDAELDAGQVVAVTGPSGSGKSTLLGIIAGWTRPTRGRVEWRHRNRRPAAEGHQPSPRITWVFQNPCGVARRTALDHVTLPLLARGLRREKAEIVARDIMAMFGVVEVARRPFSMLSGGESQRLMLARALAGAPDVMLVDEPTAQLDRTNSEAVVEVLAGLAGQGCLVVIATHDERVRRACTDVVELGAR